MKYTILYNPLAGNGSGYKVSKHLKRILKGNELDFQDFTKIVDYEDFFRNLPIHNRIVICGGDGTLNRFVNYSHGANIQNDIFYCPGGSGNDFMKDLSIPYKDEPILINEYLKHIPYVIIKDKKYFFMNGIGLGLDGYCCEEGEKTRGTSTKPINYTKIAIEAILHKYEPKNAIITVDGKEHLYRNVWLTPTMNGRYFGGGMMPTPNQDRLNPKHTVSVMVVHSIGKIKLLGLLSQIFNGTHIKYKNYIDVLEGRDIKVEYNQPAPVQIDGEVIPGVLEYHVFTR